MASEAAWNSLRLTSRKARTAPAMSDSSTSAPATRCSRMVPASSTTDTRQAASLAAQDAAAECDEGQAGHGHEGAGGHAGLQREELLDARGAGPAAAG